MEVQIIAFTEQGAELGSFLIKKLGSIEMKSQGFSKYENENVSLFTGKLEDFVRNAFSKSRAIIFIGAIGIAVRGIAPFIATKDKDPAVIVIDEFGENVIPILSGHLGGANELALKVAELINGRAIITTATDLHKYFSVDVWADKNDLHIENIENIKEISAAILRNEKVGFYCDYEVVGEIPDIFTIDTTIADTITSDTTISDTIIEDTNTTVGISISKEKSNGPYATTLHLIPKQYILGIGCRKETDENDLERFVLETLSQYNISIDLIKAVATIEIKKEEKALLAFCEKYNCEMLLYTKEELSEAKGDFTPSEFVKSIVGVDNVCERAAVLASENDQLLLTKTSQNGITIAIGFKEWRCSFERYNGRY